MVSLTALWLPIVLSGVAVFFAGFLLWMVSPHHWSDFRKLPDEDALMAELRKQAPAAGMYQFPHHASPKAMSDPAWIAKRDQGPVGTLLVRPHGGGMGKALAINLVYDILLTALVAKLAAAVLPYGSEYMSVFKVVGAAAVLGHVGAVIPKAIHYGYTWSHVVKESIDGLIYASLTAGFFGWLWPTMM